MKKTGIFKAMKLCMDFGRLRPDQRQALQTRRLRDLVAHAKENSPYYRELYRDIPADWSLEDLPPVNKRDLMAHFDEWVCDRDVKLADVEEFLKDTDNIGRKFRKKHLIFTTSGSTGNPLIAVYDTTANNIMGGIAACRSYARKEDLKAFMKRGGKTIGVFADGGFYLSNSSVRARLRSMPWKKRQMAISSALYPIPTIVRQLNDFQPAMLGGYPSHLELLIEEARACRLKISPVIIMTGGEYLSDDLRKRLADTFHCYVQTSYSCTEGGTVACECGRQHFHINEDWLLVEPVDKAGNPVPDGCLSDKILLTNLFNYTQPYIRYEVTDRVRLHREPCGCGNPAPWLELEGRTDDVVSFTQGGKSIRIAPLAIYAVMKEVPGLRRFQLLVYPENRVVLRLEEQEGTAKADAFAAARAALTVYLSQQGISRAEITLSDELPRQHPQSGKFKHVMNMQQP